MHPILIDGDAEILLVADHASDHAPADIDLGIDPAWLAEHIAIDIGTDALTRALAARLNASAVIAGVSRLVIDLNREPEAAGLIPAVSDGRVVPGNQTLDPADRAVRIERFHVPYHDAVARLAQRAGTQLLVSVHSFTPELATRPDLARPWPVGILYNRDERAARVAIDHLRAKGLLVGDNEPYSGQLLNYTMNRHAEANGLPYINIEVRQDLLSTAGQIVDWADQLAATIAATVDGLSEMPIAAQ